MGKKSEELKRQGTGYKVSPVHQIGFKAYLIIVLAMVAVAVTLLCVSIPRTRSNLETVNQNYLLAKAVDNGYILDTMLSYSENPDDVLHNYDYLTQLLGQVKLEGVGSSYAYLVDSNSVMLYHPTASKVGEPVENEVVKGVISQLQAGNKVENKVVSYDFKGVTKYAAYYVGENSNYVLVVSCDESDILSNMNSTVNMMIICAVVIVILLSAVAYIIIGMTLNPLKKVTQSVYKVAGLDFSASDDIDRLNARKDEVGMIARAVVELQKQLSAIVLDIREQGNLLVESNGEFSREFADIIQNVDDINIAVEEIAQGSTSQAQETSSAEERVIDIGKAIESNGSSVNTLEASIRKMNDVAEQSNRILEELVSINNRTKGTIGVVTEQTESTNRSAAQIKEAVVVIQDIANQTNLLSLNASIEAARAGESGRGFAVVADEIRKLAEDSANSARQIESVVTELLGSFEQSTIKMRELGEDANAQFEKLDETQSSFVALCQEIDHVSDASTDILAQTQKIGELKENISSVIQQLAAIAQENAASTEETSASMSTLASSIDRCKEETSRLNALGDELSAQTAKFKF